MTGINRRQFSLLLGCGLLSPQLLAGQKSLVFASATKLANDHYALAVASTDGQIAVEHRLPARAHHVEQHPHKPLLAVVGRRPEQFIDVVDYQTGNLLRRVLSVDGFHFYGHAIFSADGRYLISSENQISSGDGQIVIRDSEKNYSVVSSFSSGGIGPHELKLMPDGKTLVVANGGILTHPDQGRNKLNIETMQPSLAYVDITNGRILEQHFLPDELHKLSIRHLDISNAGRVVIALQYQGERHDDVPLVAFHSRGNNLQLVKAPTHINQRMKQYCGSARFDASGNYAAISSPRGDLITFWNSEGNYISSIKSRDGCGIAAVSEKGTFLISSGTGRCMRYNLITGEKQKINFPDSSPISWDNHLTNIT